MNDDDDYSKTPASRQLLNITKAMLDSAEAECARLRALLREAAYYLDPLTLTGEAVYRELGLEIEKLDDEEGK